MSLEGVRTRLVIEALQSFPPERFKGPAYRVTPDDGDPLAGSPDGRWCPGSGRSVLYCSLSSEAAILEVSRRLRDEGEAPFEGGYVLHTLELDVGSVLRLTDTARLARLGLTIYELKKDDYQSSRRVAMVARSLGFQGLMVPSAVASSANIVLFRDMVEDAAVALAGSERLDEVKAG